MPRDDGYMTDAEMRERAKKNLEQKRVDGVGPISPDDPLNPLGGYEPPAELIDQARSSRHVDDPLDPIGSYQPPKDVVEKALDREQPGRQLNDAYDQVVDLNPDESAKIARVAEKTGQDPAYVAENLTSLFAEMTRPDRGVFAEVKRAAPILYKLLAEPANMAQAKDDIEQLSLFEKVVRSARTGLKRGRGQMQIADMMRARRASGDPSLNEEAMQKIEAEIQSEGEDTGFIASAAEMLPFMKKVMERAAQRGALGATGGAAISIPFPPAAPATTLLGAKIGATYGVVEGTKDVEAALAAREYIQGGMDPEEAWKRADLVGWINGGLEATDIAVGKMFGKPLLKGLGMLSRKIPAAQKLFKHIASNPKAFAGMTIGKAVREAVKTVGEGILIQSAQEAGQEVTTAVAGGQSSVGEIVRRAAGAATTAAKATVVFGALPGAVHIGTRVSDMRQASRSREAFIALGEIAKESKLKTRNPELHKSFVDEAIKKTELENAYISVGAVERLFQSKGIDPVAAMEELGAADAYKHAAEVGPDMRFAVPMKNLVEKWSDDAVALADDVAFGDPDGPTINDLRAQEAEADATTKMAMKEVQQAAEQAVASKPEIAAAHAKIFADMQNKLSTAFPRAPESMTDDDGKPIGMKPEEWRSVMEQSSKMWADRAIIEGPKQGVTPEQWYEKVLPQLLRGEEVVEPQAADFVAKPTAVPSADALNQPGDLLQRRALTVTGEAIPSAALGAGINKSTLEVREKFTERAINMLGGLDKILGAQVNFEQGHGGYNGGINPNIIAHIIPSGDDAVDLARVELAARAIQFAFKQEAVPWFKANASKAPSANLYTFKESLTPEREQEFFTRLQEVLKDKAGYTKLNETELVVVDYSGHDSIGFFMPLQIMEEKYGEALGIERIQPFGVDSEYGYEANWREQGESEKILGLVQGPLAAASVEPSDFLGWISDRSAAFDSLLKDFEGTRLNQPGPGVMYEPMPGLSPIQQAAESLLWEFLTDPSSDTAYAKLKGTLGGKILNVDEVRNLSPEYRVNPTVFVLATQRPSNAYVKFRYNEMLARPVSGPVLLLAGGGGSGKTTAVEAANGLGEFDVVVDSVLSTEEKAVDMIEKALASGRDVQYTYVHLPVTDAALLVEMRFKLNGRFVPTDILTHDHISAQETLFKIAERYKNNPRVNIDVLFSHIGAGATLESVEALNKVRYVQAGQTADDVYQVLLPQVQEVLKNVQKTVQAASKEIDPFAGQEVEPVDVGGPKQRGEDGTAPDLIRFRQGPRAFFDPTNKQLGLLKSANASSFMHESAHVWLQDMFEFVLSGKANAEYLAEWREIEKWLGITPAQRKITTSQHEQFARGFERYLYEGNAPSLSLRTAFARFRRWMARVYKDVRRVGGELSPEVRRIFDRMLATDEQVDAAHHDQHMNPLFLDMGPKTEEYRKAIAEAELAAQERLMNKLADEVTREDRESWKIERKKTREEISSEVDSLPIYRALNAMRGKNADFKLSTEHVKDVKGIPNGISAKDGLNPDAVADMFGFNTGDEFVDALVGAEDRDTLVERMTDERMRERHGELVADQEAVANAAMDAVHNTKRAHVLRMELEYLAENHLPALKEMIRRVSRRMPPDKFARIRAQEIIGEREVGQIRPYEYLRQEARASKEAGIALARGDFDGAFTAKRRELLAHELYRAALEAREEFDKALEKFEVIATKPDDKMAKTRNMDAIEVARAILAKYGLAEEANSVDEAMAVLSDSDSDLHRDIAEMVSSVSEGARFYETISYDDFISLRDTVLTIDVMARRSRQALIGEQLMDRNEINARLLNAMMRFETPHAKDRYSVSMSKEGRRRFGLLQLKAYMRRVENWISAMDVGDNAGEFRQFIWNPITKSTAEYRVQQGKYLDKLLKMMKGIEKKLSSHERIAAPELGSDIVFTRSELLHAILHSGNVSNLSKLLRGRGWGALDRDGTLDTSKWDGFIERLQAQGVLTKSDYDFVQGVWDLFEELRPKAQETFKDMYGHNFGEIETRPVETPWGKYRGGYVPATADRLLATEANVRANAEDALKKNNTFRYPTTGEGFTKKRVEQYTPPLELNLRSLTRHLDAELRFIYIQPRVKDVARIIFDRDVRRALDSIDPTLVTSFLTPWLQRTAQQLIETPAEDWTGLHVWRTIRTRSGINIMAGNVVNTLQQPLGLSLAALKVKPRNLSKSLFQYMWHPKRLAKEISALSPFMATRVTASLIETRRHIDDLISEGKFEKAQAFAHKHAYFLQAGTQNVVDIIVWWASYNESMAKNLDEKQSILKADSDVRETQGSFAPEDVSRFETGSAFARMFTMFQSYFNMQANLLGTEYSNFVHEDLGLIRGAGRLVYVYTFGFLIPAVIAEAIAKAGFGEPWDADDDGEYMDDFLALFFGAQQRTATAFFPFAGPIINAGINQFNNKWYDDRIGLSPAISQLESAVRSPKSVYKAIGDEGSKATAVKDTLTLLSMLSGLPLTVIGRPAAYLTDVAEGEAEPDSPYDFARGLITGKRGKSQ